VAVTGAGPAPRAAAVRRARLPRGGGAPRLLGLLLVLAAAPAGAWESSAHWSVHVVGYRVNPANLDVTDAQALTALRFGAQAWTDQSRAAFRFRYDGTSSSTTLGMDGQNLVFFRDAEGSSPTVRATTYTWKTGTTILETDIVFWDRSIDFVVQGLACNDAVYLEDVAIHEFGHALGLDHTTVTAATMYGHGGACSLSRIVLDPDDVAGVEALYPCAAAAECNDGRVCTADTCQNSRCRRTPIAGCCTAAADCDDGDACTTDACVANSCTHTAIAGCCTTAAQCDDGNACTTDACTSHQCRHTAIAGCCTTAAQCDDGNACTTDACTSHQCRHTAIAGCCTTAVQCDDGDACTTDACTSHQCRHTAIAGCCAAPCDGGAADAAADGARDAADGSLPGVDARGDVGDAAGPDGETDAGRDPGLDAGVADDGAGGADGDLDGGGPAGGEGGPGPGAAGAGAIQGGCGCALAGRRAPDPRALLGGWLALGWLLARSRRRP
jgi:hypothetical protein